MDLPWTEKYRPKDLVDICSHNRIVSTLDNLMDCNRLPHLLFYGPPGSGKTSVILCCAKKLYGDLISAYIIHLNASDERGIDIVRQKIKDFCNADILFHTKKFKLVILDEADAMTEEAQLALREIIFRNTKKVRFCLICNYVSKIIPQLKSRFSSFHFSPLKEEDMLKKISIICKEENIHCDKKSLKLIYKMSNGDFRKYINIIQSLSLQFNKINEDIITKNLGFPNDTIIHIILESCIHNKNIQDNYNLIMGYIQDGYQLDYILDCIVSKLLDYSFTNERLLYIIPKLNTIKINDNIHLSLKVSYLSSIFAEIL